MSKENERCKAGGHIWGASVIDNYEMCQMCKEFREKRQTVLPPITKKERENQDESQPTENRRIG